VILLDVICHARDHRPGVRGCRCPHHLLAPTRGSGKSRSRYVPGRPHNRYGPRRRTVPDDAIDPVAVERAAAGDRSIVLAVAERAAAIDTLDRYGLSAREVAIRLGVTTRTVTRRRADWLAERLRKPT
jgi:hypothetical protein